MRHSLNLSVEFSGLALLGHGRRAELSVYEDSAHLRFMRIALIFSGKIFQSITARSIGTFPIDVFDGCKGEEFWVRS